MPQKVKVIGKPMERLLDTGKPMRRVSQEEFAAALGAEPIRVPIEHGLDLIGLGTLGTELIRRLRSTGGRPALAEATERCKVSLSPADISDLESIIGVIEQQTGTKPALGQVAGVIIHLYLEAVKKAGGQNGMPSSPGKDDPNRLPHAALKELVEETVRPIRAELKRLGKTLGKAKPQRK
jgi:hypothetical protein